MATTKPSNENNYLLAKFVDQHFFGRANQMNSFSLQAAGRSADQRFGKSNYCTQRDLQPAQSTSFKMQNNARGFNQLPPKKWPPKPQQKTLQFCVFCKNNGAQERVYSSHKLKDNNGRVCCPRLREYVCTICGAFGDNAHTVRYCPKRELLN